MPSATGMKDAGYQYVVIDDCWQVSRRQAATSFPIRSVSPGMKAVADYVHSKGLKFGLYSDAGFKTCQLVRVAAATNIRTRANMPHGESIT